MIDALIAGKLQGAAEQRIGNSGKPFTVAKVRAAGSDGESIFVNVIAFSATAAAALMALNDGDSLALSGSLKVKVWTDRQGVAKPSLDMTASQVLTAYHVSRKRKAVAASANASEGGSEFPGEHDPLNF
jgi:single-stranded DNA-binding protein